MFVTGALLFAAHATKAYESRSFRAKVALLVLAGINTLVFHLTIDRRRVEWNAAPVPPAGGPDGGPAVAGAVAVGHCRGPDLRLRLVSPMVWDTLQPVVHWLGDSAFGQWLGQSPVRIAALFVVHLAGLTLLLGGTIVISLRLARHRLSLRTGRRSWRATSLHGARPDSR